MPKKMAEIAQLEEMNQAGDRIIWRLVAENKRLRSALEKIVKAPKLDRGDIAQRALDDMV